MNGPFIAPLSAKCLSDLVQLRLEFFSNLDVSLVAQEFGRILKDPNSADASLLGEGADCRAYALPGNTITITIPKESFQKRTPPDVWIRRLNTLAAVKDVPLIPPMQTINVVDQWALITPFGDQSAHHAAEHWQPLSKWIEFAQTALRQYNLVVDDVFQIRSRRGVPFIIDFSDLQLIGDS